MLDCLCGSVDRGCSGEKVRWIHGVVPWWMAGSRVFGSARRDQMGQDLGEAGRHRLGVCCNSSPRKQMRGGDYGCVLYDRVGRSPGRDQSPIYPSPPSRRPSDMASGKCHDILRASRNEPVKFGLSPSIGHNNIRQ